MNKEEILNKVTAAIANIKEETDYTVIKDYSLSPFFDLGTGEESGVFVTFVCGPQFVLSEALLNYWKEQIGANDFQFKYYRLQLYLVFFVDYNKYEELESKTDSIKTNINKAISAAIAYSFLDQETADKCFAWVEKQDVRIPVEVKEVNLDNHTIMEEIRKCGCNPNEFDIAKHFFELGLKTIHSTIKEMNKCINEKIWRTDYDSRTESETTCTDSCGR